MTDTPVVFCTYCLAHNSRTTAVMGMVVSSPDGEIPIHLCRRHLDDAVRDMIAVQRKLDAGKPIVMPPKRNLRVVAPC